MSRPVPRLHLIGDRTLCPLARFPRVARLAVAAGVGAVHLREKDLPGGVLLETARGLATALGERALLVINERIDIAMLVRASGVQLGEAAIGPREARALLGAPVSIGRSVHDVAGAERAAVEGADFLLAGHVYASRSKPGQPPGGLELIRRIAAATPVPVIAVGGITPARVPEVLAAGAHGVAVISGILGASDPAAAARAFAWALQGEEDREDE